MEIPLSIVGLLGFVFLFVLISLDLPVAFALAFTGFAGIWYVSGPEAALNILPVTLWENISSYTLTCLPLFVLMGMYAYESDIGPDLYNVALKWFGRLPGGLAITTVWGCCAFGAVTGSSTAGVLTFTPMAYQPMIDLGYDKRLASGCIICGATMGTIIPPSITFVIYGALTQVSIGKLFIAGIFPGIMEAVLYTVVILLISGLSTQAGSRGPHSTMREKIASLRKVWGMLSIFLLVIGGLYGGIFTPTEAAAVGAAGTLVILLIRKGFNSRLLAAGIEETLRTGGMLLLIMASAVIFANFIALTGLSRWLSEFITASGLGPYQSLFGAFVLLFIAGCIMPATAMLVLFVPLFFPVFVETMGFDGVWFGVWITVLVEIAMVTPPIGINLFAFWSLMKEKISTEDMWRGVIPFVFADIARLAIITAFPIIALWLPNLMYQ